MHQWKRWVVSASMATLVVVGVVGCGGGGSSTPKKVYVAGDSLSDVGVYGMRFTVQSGDAKNPHRVWTEHVAASIGAAYPCAAYDGLQSFAAKSGCTAYAVGGAQINPATLNYAGLPISSVTIGSDATPQSVIQQIKDVGKNTFRFDDLVLVNGGGNDIKILLFSLVEAFAGFGGNPNATAAYKTLMKDLLPAATVDATPDTQLALPGLGTQYMQALATMLSNAVKSELLAKEAQRVLVLNLPNVAKAPVLNTQPQPVKDLASLWTQAFNDQLKKELGGESKVLIVDFDAKLGDWINNPTNAKLNGFNLTNVTAKACGTTALRDCSDAVLNASGPSDWKTYLFVDDLHATPFANQLMGQWVTEQIKAKGW